MDDKIEFAIVTEHGTIKQRMRPQSSIFSAEQQVIITALENTTQTRKPTVIATDSLSSLLAASGNRWTRNPKTRDIRKLIDNSRNQINLKWVPSHAGISGNEVADQAAKDALTEEIDNQEPYPPLDLIKWTKKEESRSRQVRWERGENEMKNRKTSVSLQNDTVEVSRREQVIIPRRRTGYPRATHRHIIEKTDTPKCPFCEN
jgi:ribonuclease HI